MVKVLVYSLVLVMAAIHTTLQASHYFPVRECHQTFKENFQVLHILCIYRSTLCAIGRVRKTFFRANFSLVQFGSNYTLPIKGYYCASWPVRESTT